MGTWDIGIFDNDTACDWLYELEDREDLSLVLQALENVIEVEDDYLDAPDAEKALAAAETVARLKGNGGKSNASTEILDQWVGHAKIVPAKDIVKKSMIVIDRILREPSELLANWKEESDFDDWKNVIADLKERLKR